MSRSAYWSADNQRTRQAVVVPPPHKVHELLTKRGELSALDGAVILDLRSALASNA